MNNLISEEQLQKWPAGEWVTPAPEIYVPDDAAEYAFVVCSDGSMATTGTVYVSTTEPVYPPCEIPPVITFLTGIGIAFFAFTAIVAVVAVAYGIIRGIYELFR